MHSGKMYMPPSFSLWSIEIIFLIEISFLELYYNLLEEFFWFDIQNLHPFLLLRPIRNPSWLLIDHRPTSKKCLLMAFFLQAKFYSKCHWHMFSFKERVVAFSLYVPKLDCFYNVILIMDGISLKCNIQYHDFILVG